MTTRILTGDCRDVLRTLDDVSVQCVVTSPPYWGLRDYDIEPQVWGGDPACAHEWGDQIHKTGGSGFQGKNSLRLGRANVEAQEKVRDAGNICVECGAWRGCLGLEPDYQMFVEHMTEVFREVHRVLRNDGTLWLNLGDTYATGAGLVGERPGGGARGDRWAGAAGKHGYVGNAVPVGPMTQPNRMPQVGLKPKELAGIPWRVAFALQADGWWLRQEIIWHKPNPMPESVTDRCTKAHESIFLLTKNGNAPLLWRHDYTRSWVALFPEPDYVWRHRKTREETREAQTGEDWIRVNLWGGRDYFFDDDAIAEPSIYGQPNSPGSIKSPYGQGFTRRADTLRTPTGWDTEEDRAHGTIHADGRRGRASGNKTHKGVEAYEESETEEHRTKAGLLKIAETVYPTRNKRSVWTVATEPFPQSHFATFPPALIVPCILAGCPEGGTVLDPFGGAGTTGLVADRLKRNAILVELNPDFAAMAKARIDGDCPMFTEVTAA